MTYTILRILTYVLGITGSSLLLPLIVALLEGERNMVLPFLLPMIAAWMCSIVFWLKVRVKPKVIGIQDAFSVVGILWIVICIFGAVPLYFSGGFPSFTDAMFESVSGFTTTGATVLSDVESLPRSVNVWRCETHWLGGMGVVALAVAMIPLLGAGGFRLIKAETSGPDKTKFTSSVATTAKVLWFFYISMTIISTLLLWHCGMDYVDAVCHAFSSMGTGGFSSRNESVGAFGLPSAEWICILFMLLASVNFMLYCRLLSGHFMEVFRNSELRAFCLVFPVAVLAIFIFETTGHSIGADSFRDACFQAASMITSTGFMTCDYTAYLPASQIVIIALCLAGGCSGSTASGIKIIRWTVLSKQFVNEIRRHIHPYGVFSLRINGLPVREGVVLTVASFVFAYILLVMVTALIGAAAGLDIVSAVSGAFSMVGNVGPAFGQLGPTYNYGGIPDSLKWWYMLAMLAGRLEIYTLLLLFGNIARKRSSVKE
jgi:trk system potassium uptake protein TrkH